MSSTTTHNLPCKRYTRQVVTDPQALLATNVAAANALMALKIAPWLASASSDDVTFPARNPLQDGLNDLWDAFKHVGNYASGYQQAYAGMVAYRYKVPADALTAPADVTSIAIPLYVDRWLVDGVRVSAYLSDTPTPPTDWTTAREGDVHLDAQLPMTYTDPEGARIVIEKSDTITLTFPATTPAKQYLYVMITLEAYGTTRGFWIEGSSLTRGESAVTTFAVAVAEDVDPDAGFEPPIATADLIYVHGSPTAYDGLTGPYADATYAQQGAIRKIDIEIQDYVVFNALPDYPARASALANQTMHLCDAHTAYSGVYVNPTAKIQLTTTQLQIVSTCHQLTLRMDTSTQIDTVKWESAINAFPNVTRFRLNVYCYAISSLYADDDEASTVLAYSDDPDWLIGNYTGNSLQNLLTMDVAPEGHAAGSIFPASGATLVRGLYRVFITCHPYYLSPSFASVAGGLTGVQVETYRLLFNR